MRGLGIGILLTTLIFIISDNKDKMTDKEIIARATDLGMVMRDKQNTKDVLDDGASDQNLTGTPEPSMTEAPTASPTPSGEAETTDAPEPATDTSGPAADASESADDAEPGKTQNPDVTTDTASTQSSGQGQTSDAAGQPGNSGTDKRDNADGQNNASVDEQMGIVVPIIKGMSSGKVAKLLQDLGLVDDADKFNDYIVKAGKADVIWHGTYTIPKDASYEEIMDIISE